MHTVERAAMIKNTWRQNNWDETSLIEMANSVTELFDFDSAESQAKKKRKRFEELSWETIYCKLKARKFKLVGEEEVNV